MFSEDLQKLLVSMSNRLDLLDRKITELELKKADKPKYSYAIDLGKPYCFGRYDGSCFNCNLKISCEEEATKGA